MKKSFLTSQFHLLLFSFVFIASCKGQEKTNIPEASVIESKTEVPWVDPLFFIEGQLCQHVRKIFQDKSGNLWFGTNVYDLMRYNGDTLAYFSEKDGLGGGRITGIVEDAAGNVWFGTYGGLTKYDPVAHLTGGKTLPTGQAGFTNFTEKDGLINNDIWSLIIDSKGIFWIGTAEGVSQFDGEVFTPFSLPHPDIENKSFHISPERVSCIAEDKNGNYWFGTDGYGICKYDPVAHREAGKTLPTTHAGFTHFTKENGFIDNNIYGFMVDKKGNVWIGTMYGGVSMYDGKSFTNFTEDGIIEGIEVGGFYEDKIGNVWFAAENFGVYRYDGKSFTNLYKKEGLVTNGILSIFEDKEGRFWFGGWGGLFRYDPVGNGAGGKSLPTGQAGFFPVTKEGPWH